MPWCRRVSATNRTGGNGSSRRLRFTKSAISRLEIDDTKSLPADSRIVAFPRSVNWSWSDARGIAHKGRACGGIPRGPQAARREQVAAVMPKPNPEYRGEVDGGTGPAE